MEVLALYERALADTGRIVADVRADQMRLPTPCPDWDVGFMLHRIVAVNRSFAGVAAPGLEVEDGLHAAYEQSAAAALAAFSAAGAMDRTVMVNVGEVPGRVALWIALCTVSVHGWDLATATGQDPTIAPEIAEPLLAFMTGFVTAEFRRPPPSLFGPAVPVAEDASPSNRLVAFLGRRP